MKDTKSTKNFKNKPRKFSDLSYKVIGCALEVHRVLGTGLLESAYQRCLAHEFDSRGIAYKADYPLTTYIKLLNAKEGLLINFNALRLKSGPKRLVI
jgi:hypothetical protein